MNVMTVIKKIGEKIISVVEWPIKYSVLLVTYFVSAEKDYPATRAAFVGLLQRFEALGPDALAAIAANGFNVPDDVKVAADLAGLFRYLHTDVLPVIESDYADFEKDGGNMPANPVGPEPVPAAPGSAAPGLHNVVPA